MLHLIYLLAVTLAGLAACQPDPQALPGPPVLVANVTEGELVMAPPATCPPTLPEPYSSDPRLKEGRAVVVFKQDYLLGLYVDGRLAEVSAENPETCFPVAMGRNPTQPKTKEDFQSTPEGWYWVGGKVPQGVSKFHKALAVSYPNTEDAQRAFEAGVVDKTTRDKILRANTRHVMPPQNTPMGGAIMIHGAGSWPQNWTWGCMALDNDNMDWLYGQIRVRDQILILPWSFKITAP